jgi:glycosidase
MKSFARFIPTLLTLWISGSVLINAAETIPVSVEPPLWWTGMRNPELMLTIEGKGIAGLTPEVTYPGVHLKSSTRSENSDYLFLTLEITKEALPGMLSLRFTEKGKVRASCQYEIKPRQPGSAARAGFGPKDVIYLLMPDRFANGNPGNDSVEELAEKVNRTNPDGRHGGDIQGIIDHLDYLRDLGVTALWTTPLLEDNMPTYSYHTYAATNYYKVDARYGTNTDYARLAEECHTRGIKLIMDMVPNHCGSEHRWMKNLPMKDWVHRFPDFTRSNYTISTINDPHAAEADRMLSVDGWFDTSMPDLNQNNPFVLQYFKQFAIFWVEFAGLDGIRVDTYPYNDKFKIAEWTQAILDEYPYFNITGECWLHNPAETAYWQTGTKNHDNYDSHLPAVMDFPLMDAFGSAFNEESWDQGLSRFYNTYVLDYLFGDPVNQLIFLDNHDSERYSERIGFDIRKYKMAVAHLLTTRGIPQIYYGTEILMGGQKSKGDGDIRHDFPGGWPGDSRSAFTHEGRTAKENEAFDFIRTLLLYRKSHPVIARGKLVQFIPRDNVYVYFRILGDETLMVVMNNDETGKTISTDRFRECIRGNTAKNILTGENVVLDNLQIEGKQVLLLEIL